MSELVVYGDGEPFPGVIGRTSGESSPAWPTPPRASDGAPNVLIFVLDDVDSLGRHQLGCSLGQGFLFSHAVDSVAAGEFVMEQSRRQIPRAAYDTDSKVLEVSKIQ